MSDLSAPEYLHRLKHGDAEAFRQLVESRKDRVFNLCMRYLRQRQDAEDAAQEVFLKIHRTIDTFREDAELDTWIYRVTVTTSLDFLRRRRRKQPWSLFNGPGTSDGAPPMGHSGDSGRDGPMDGIEMAERSGRVPGLVESDDPETGLQERQRAGALSKAIDSLPEAQRSAILLHYMEELSYEEVSVALDVSFSAVESLLFRARRNLRKRLGEHPLFAEHGGTG